MSQILQVLPMGPLVNIHQLVDCVVVAELFDDPVYRHERYIGTIDEVKINRRGVFVHFKAESGPSPIIGKKWLPLHKVVGLAHIQTQKAAS